MLFDNTDFVQGFSTEFCYTLSVYLTVTAAGRDVHNTTNKLTNIGKVEKLQQGGYRDGILIYFSCLFFSKSTCRV